MNYNNLLQKRARKGRPQPVLVFCAALCVACAGAILPVQGAALIDLPFSDGAPGTTENHGNSGGVGTWVQQGLYPDHSANVPSGPFAPTNNTQSVDFGPILTDDGGRAIDFPVESAAPLNGLRAFTIAGWINLRNTTNGPGGNRVMGNHNGGATGQLGLDRQRGFDLVQVHNSTISPTGGRLRIGINAAPDQDAVGPFSSNNKLTANPNAPADNWVFFAVTYDARTDASTDGEVRYYFGNAQTAAALDTGVGSNGVQTYDRGPVVDGGFGFTLGNFIGNGSAGLTTVRNLTGVNSRVLRSLLDELRFFPGALDLAAIQEVQKSSPTPVPPRIADLVPGLNATFHTNNLGIRFKATSPNTVPVGGISLVLNGVDVSSQLTISGDPTSRDVAFSGLQPNQFYDAVITVTNAMGSAVAQVKFDTMLQSHFSFEAEDWNFDGGQFIDNPVPGFIDPNSYVDRGGTLGVQGVDFNELNPTAGPGSGATVWRRETGAQLPQTVVTADFLRDKFSAAGDQDFQVVNIVGGEWLNYTRTFPQTNYHVYLRAASTVPQQVRLERVSGNRAEPGQTTSFMGVFNVPVTSGLNQFVPLMDASGQFQVTAQLSGLQTLRLASASANNNLFLNYVMLVPAAEVVLPPTVVITSPVDGAIFNTTPISLATTASDDGQVAKVKFTFTPPAAGTSVGEVTNAPYTIPWTPPADGIYTVTAEATDNAGLTALSAPVRVTLDTRPPAANFVGSVDGQSVKVVFSETIQRAAAENLSSYQLPSHSGVTVVQATLQLDGRTLDLRLSSSITGQFSLAMTGLADLAGNPLPATPVVGYVSAHRGAIIDLPFSEGTGTSTRNLGFGGGTGTFVRQEGLPVFTNNVPSGPFAPPANSQSVDFGLIGATNGGRSIAFPVSSTIPTTGLRSFTLSGWINLRDTTFGPGGNRIISSHPGGAATPQGRQRGFDLVQVGNTAASPTGARLRIGINAAPDQDAVGPFSSDDTLTAVGDSTAPGDNWVFFAVTYDAKTDANNDGEIQYYFGNAQTAAAPDPIGPQIYDRGAVIDPGIGFAVGNFAPSADAVLAAERIVTGPNSRVLRGLVDDLKLLPYAMTLSEIQTAQKAPLEIPPVAAITSPVSEAVLTVGNNLTITADASDSDGAIVQVEFVATSSAGSVISLGTDTAAPFSVTWSNLPAGTYSLSARATDSTGLVAASAPVLIYVGTVSVEGLALVELPFSENSGTTTTNIGASGGTGDLTQTNGFPMFSANVPTGPYAPPGNQRSINFGAITASDGNRAIDFPVPVATTTSGRRAFTITGWINLLDGTIGAGGNRIFTTWPNTVGGGIRSGIELVVVSPARLRASVNGAPDFPDNTGPFSSNNVLPIDPTAPATNWTFFAFTYNDPTDDPNDGAVSYYFGNGSTPAALDSTGAQSYSRGAVVDSREKLTIGNFTPAVPARTLTGTGSRTVRALLDEIRFFPVELTLTQIRMVQQQQAAVVIVGPELSITRTGGQVSISWEGPGTLESTDTITGQWQAVAGATSPHPVTPAGTRFYRLRVP